MRKIVTPIGRRARVILEWPVAKHVLQVKHGDELPANGRRPEGKGR